jgi:hypothetical protein
MSPVHNTAYLDALVSSHHNLTITMSVRASEK